MMSKTLSLRETGLKLLEHRKLALCTHVSPDGDTLGSTLGLARYLSQQGKEIALFCDDVINKTFDFLPGIELFRAPDAGEAICCDLLVVIDASSFDRIGAVGQAVRAKEVLNIDHHISNTGFADFLYLDSKAAATGEIMCDLFEQMGWGMDKDMASCFYTAILTDCGFFRNANTTPKTMRRAAGLLECGAEPSTISDCLEMHSHGMLILLGKVLQTLDFACGGKIAYMTVANSLYRKDIDMDTFISYPRYTEGVEVALLFKETEPGTVRVSMRSRAVDVAKIALAFGGGGHARAAGCTVNLPLEKARESVLAAIAREL